MNKGQLSTQDKTSKWRLHPGYLSPGYSEFESIHILLGRFIADRHSLNPLSEKSLLTGNDTFKWGESQPLEKVINSQKDFDLLMKYPRLFRNAITIIEPWEHVGYNHLGEEVRASLNVAYIARVFRT
ncbi:hypothetical protein [Gloeocapsa sp. PCC 73106]|uniref:hypothetical protein n=1 Tax=Gloeocapsa sp. PCC 73106 TaxID=102232 RepID=UPI0002AC43F4|nr:hypothetical protein [Gloeocapsa sp. PCC 73106]ELR97901.1 hypothetical protein GLO73106DRAFT_00017190 [Gloeocapsa sp. PCC 73106]